MVTSNESHFNVPVWLLSASMDKSQKTLNNWINSLHKRAVWLVYNDLKLLFHQLLEKVNSATVYQCNLQTLAIEIFKVYNNIAPEIILRLNDY